MLKSTFDFRLSASKQFIEQLKNYILTPRFLNKVDNLDGGDKKFNLNLNYTMLLSIGRI